MRKYLTGIAVPPGRLYARFGMGPAIYTIDGGVEGGFGIMAGTGYEFRPTRALGVGLNWYHGDFNRFGASVLQAGLSVVVL